MVLCFAGPGVQYERKPAEGIFCVAISASGTNAHANRGSLPPAGISITGPKHSRHAKRNGKPRLSIAAGNRSSEISAASEGEERAIVTGNLETNNQGDWLSRKPSVKAGWRRSFLRFLNRSWINEPFIRNLTQDFSLHQGRDCSSETRGVPEMGIATRRIAPGRIQNRRWHRTPELNGRGHLGAGQKRNQALAEPGRTIEPQLVASQRTSRFRRRRPQMGMVARRRLRTPGRGRLDGWWPASLERADADSGGQQRATLGRYRSRQQTTSSQNARVPPYWSGIRRRAE